MSYINEEARFILDRYRTGGANRFTCPNCGRKKCFTRYVDTETSEYLADNCGKCNHESSCHYHYPPRDFFRDHPDARQKYMSNQSYVSNSPCILKTQTPTHIVNTVCHQNEFFQLSWAEKATLRLSTFSTWFMTLPFDSDVIKQVLADYYVGATAKDIIAGGINYGPAVVFWMIDEQQRVHDAKLIAYKTDGHRVPDWANSMRSICEKKGIGPQLNWTEKVLFGLHLLPKYPDKVACIVESEKTALICACRYPQFVWLATGGCSNLQPEKLRPLMQRRVIVYPDSGELDKWKDKMKASGHTNYTVIDFMEKYVPNTDIADIILGEAKTKTEAEQEHLWQKMKERQPALQELEDKLSLELMPPSEPCPF